VDDVEIAGAELPRPDLHQLAPALVEREPGSDRQPPCLDGDRKSVHHAISEDGPVEQMPPIEEIALLDAEGVGGEALAVEVVVPAAGLVVEIAAAFSMGVRLVHECLSCRQRKRVPMSVP